MTKVRGTLWLGGASCSLGRLILNFFKSTHFPRPRRPGCFHLGEMLYGRLPPYNVKTT